MGLFDLMRRERIEDGTMRDRFGPDSDYWYAPVGWYDAARDTGIAVTPELAMTISAVWAGVTFMARNMGSFPCITYERFEPRPGREGRRRAKQDVLYRMFHRRPNRQQTPLEYFEMEVGHILLRGNFYAHIVEGSRSFAEQSIPIHPDLVQVERLPSGRLRYQVIERTGVKAYLDEEIHHVRGFMSDGVKGISLPAVAARSIGAAVAAETYSARLLSRGVTASLAVTTPEQYLGDEEAEKALHKSIARYLTGLDNAGGVLLVPPGATIDKLGIAPKDLEILSTREHTVREVARWLGLPTQVLADAGKEPTHASAEFFGLQLVTQCFRPMAVRIEQAMERDFILPRDADRLVIEFLMDALLRGDMKARAQFYQWMILSGVMTPNEAREKENFTPGPEALDEFLRPRNIGRASEDLDDDVDDTRPRRNRSQVEARFGVRATLCALELAGRLVRKEMAAVQKAARTHANDGAGWSAWIREFYGGDDYPRHVAATLKVPLPIAREYAARQGLSLEQSPVGVAIVESWPDTVPADLAALALGDFDVMQVPTEGGRA